MKADVSDLLGFLPRVHVFVWDIVLLLSSIRRFVLETVKNLKKIYIANRAWEVVTCLIILHLVMFSTVIREYNFLGFILKKNIFITERPKA